MWYELMFMVIAAAIGLVISLAYVRFFPKASRRSGEWLLGFGWKSNAAFALMFALFSFFSFRDGFSWGGWFFVCAGSLNLTESIGNFRYSSAMERILAGRDDPRLQRRRLRQELVAAALIAVVGGAFMQRVAYVAPAVPDVLGGKNVVCVGPGPYVVPRGVDFVLTGLESSGTSTSAFVFVNGDFMVGHSSSRLAKPPESHTNLNGTRRVESGSTLELRSQGWTRDSVDPLLPDDGLRAWGYLEQSDD